MNTTHRVHAPSRACRTRGPRWSGMLITCAPASLRRVAPIAALITSAALIACSSAASANKPSDREIEADIRAALLADGKDKVMSVENFKKLNGIPNSDGSYMADVSYDLVFKQSYKDLQREYQIHASKTEAQLGPVGTYLFMFDAKHGDWEAGQHFPMHDEVPFIKTEKGWIIPSEP